MARMSLGCGRLCGSGRNHGGVSCVILRRGGFSVVGQRMQLNRQNRLRPVCVAYTVSCSSVIAEQPKQSLALPDKQDLEVLWRDLFANPASWWDNRAQKRLSHQPDFRHKVTRKELWVRHEFNPSWVDAELNAYTEGLRSKVEKLWIDFFETPSLWWDNRDGKLQRRPTSADFKRKGSDEGLWIESDLNPAWVKEKLATMIEDGTLQARGLSKSFTWKNLEWDKDSLCSGEQLEAALQTLDALDEQGVRASITSFVTLLHACGDMKNLEVSKKVQAYARKMGYETSNFVGLALLNTFAKCGSVVDAREAFEKLPNPNAFAYKGIIKAYAEHGKHDEVLKLFHQMIQADHVPCKFTSINALKACASLGSLEQGKAVHDHITKAGLELDVYLGSIVVDMYAKCKSVGDARAVFDVMGEHNVVSWNSMIAGYAQHGPAEEAFHLYKQMQARGLQPDAITFIHMLRACISLSDAEKGKQIHADAKAAHFESNIFVESAIVDMYAKCGSIEEARQVFSKANPNPVTWNAMIAGYAEHGRPSDAITLYDEMLEQGVKPNQATFVNVLKACQSHQDLEQGKKIHTDLRQAGFEEDVYAGTALVGMYGRCGKLEDAVLAFSKIKNKNVVSWNGMLTEYARYKRVFECAGTLKQMQKEGVEPCQITFITMFRACGNAGAVTLGRVMHREVIKRALISNLVVKCALIDMYVKCGCMDEARTVLDKSDKRSNVMWNTIISGYARHGPAEEAFKLFEQMQEEGFTPDEITFLHMFQACGFAADHARCAQLHAEIVKRGYGGVFLGNAMVDTYVKCDQIEDARKVFDGMKARNLASWNAMIGGYVQHLHDAEALTLFSQLCKEGSTPSASVFRNILKACARTKDLESGKQVHDEAKRSGLELHADVGSALVDMYLNCESLSDARELFDRLPVKDATSWEAKAAGYVRCSPDE